MVIITMSNHKKQSGFTLLEVMIALVIFSIGLIGLAGLQGISLENNQVAYSRTMATMLAYDMADRIRNNPGQDYTATIPASAPSPNCAAAACSPGEMKAFDLYEWQQTVIQTQNILTSAVVLITRSSATAYNISIGWDEGKKGNTIDCTASPLANGVACVNLAVNL